MSTSEENVSFAEATRSQIAAYRRMGPTGRWAEACKMRRFAWNLKTEGIKSVHPDWSPAQIEAEVRKLFLHGST
jgi:hypothetical protein